MTGRRWRRRKQLLGDLKEKRSYWKLKMGAQDRTVCENSIWNRLWKFVRLTTEWMVLSAYVHCFQFRPIYVSYNMWHRRRTYVSYWLVVTNIEFCETCNRQQVMTVRRAYGTRTWELQLVLSPSDNEIMAQMLWVDWQRKWKYFDKNLYPISEKFVSW